jgi:hypothetical protein
MADNDADQFARGMAENLEACWLMLARWDKEAEQATEFPGLSCFYTVIDDEDGK